MTRQELDATWIPRIGPEATAELRRYRRVGGIGMVMPLFAGVAGLLIGTSTLGDFLGVVLAVVVAICIAEFIRSQRRLAAAMSRWFGVKIRGVPRMNTKRFDDWAQKRGLHSRSESAEESSTARTQDAPP
jgi:hypothetical protein